MSYFTEKSEAMRTTSSSSPNLPTCLHLYSCSLSFFLLQLVSSPAPTYGQSICLDLPVSHPFLHPLGFGTLTSSHFSLLLIMYITKNKNKNTSDFSSYHSISSFLFVAKTPLKSCPCSPFTSSPPILSLTYSSQAYVLNTPLKSLLSRSPLTVSCAIQESIPSPHCTWSLSSIEFSSSFLLEILASLGFQIIALSWISSHLTVPSVPVSFIYFSSSLFLKVAIPPRSVFRVHPFSWAPDSYIQLFTWRLHLHV